MTEARWSSRRFLALALAGTSLLLGLLARAPSAEAAYGAFGQVGAGVIKWGEEGSPGEVFAGTGHPHGFAVDPATGDFFIADEYFGEEERVYARIQEFEPSGQPIAENRVELEQKEPEVESLQLAVGGEPSNEYVYMLVVDQRHESAFDGELTAVSELYKFSTAVEGKKLKNEKELTTQAAFMPFAKEKEHKAPLLQPSGIAVEPESPYDVVITAQQEEGTNPKEEEEDLHAVVQRVHTQGQHEGELGPRYVDEANCLDDGEDFKEGEECAKGRRASEERPSSPVVTPTGKVYVEEHGAAGEIWEVPASQNASNSFENAEKVEDLTTIPKRLFTLGEEATHELKYQGLEFASNEEEGGSMSFVPSKSGEGMFYVLAEVAQGEGEDETQQTGVALIDYTAGSEAKELGWTGAGPEAPPTSCSITGKAESQGLRIAGDGGEQALAFNSGAKGDESFAEVLRFGPEAHEACGKPSVTPPRAQVGENGNAAEVEAGKNVTLSSIMHGGDALSAEWKFKYTSEGGEKGEELAVQTPDQHRQPSLSHAFEHTGEYEIVETIHTDCLGDPTVSITRKGLKVVTALSPLKARLLPFAPARAQNAATLEAEVADEAEQPQHLKYKWSFGDGTTHGEETPQQGVSGNAKLRTQHTYSSPGVYEVSLEVENAHGVKAARVTAKVTVGESEQEQHEREAREKSEREQHEREQHEREQHEREAREKAEREQHEREQQGKTGVEGQHVIHNPEATLAGKSLSVSASGALPVKVVCPTGETSCIGTITLRTLRAVSAGAHKKKKIITLASGSFTVAGGQAKLITLHLSSAARALLARSHELAAEAILVAHDSANVTRTVKTQVTLRLAKPAGKRKH